MKSLTKLLAVVAAAMLIVGCDLMESGNNDPDYNPIPAIPFDTQIVLEASEKMPAVAIEEDYYVFDVSGVDIEFNELEISFLFCGFPGAWVYNFAQSRWDEIAYRVTGYGCRADRVPTHIKRLSYYSADVSEYIAEGIVRLKVTGQPKSDYVGSEWHEDYLYVRAFRLNPAYVDLPIHKGERPIPVSIMGYDGTRVWMLSRNAGITTLSPLESPGQSVQLEHTFQEYDGMAYDGLGFWLTNYTNIIERVDLEGNVTGQLVLPDSINMYGVAWLADKLWIRAFDTHNTLMIVINPASLGVADSAVIEREFTLPYYGMAFSSYRNTLLFAGADTLYTLSQTGEVLVKKPIPVRSVVSIAADGSSLWMYHKGIRSMEYVDPALSRFLLP